ncbi:MAG: acyltransferase [Bradyrhizobium sp.]|uniref:acyltransferase family protein n=1 Tax=Bradyrhizobium sp. TaxID=376 RepID=UPI001212C1BF|nr:acyltransferase [Bradyrhizobium sp.]THD74212.1 MAG: acyltransferase [Bradyrhizobium sp.]
MTSISSSVAPAQTRAAPKAKARNAALDRARTFITMLVLIHHSVIAYTYFGHTDPQSFLGFDGVVTFNDSFFMEAMFFLSGLFVWPSLQRKGTGWFLRDRWWRLGLPFIVCALILMPVAYYAVDLRVSGANSFAEFWWKTVTVGPWPSGPAWFVWVLLALDVIAAGVYLAAPGCVEAIGRLSRASFARPGLFFWALLIGSIVVYVPPVLYFGASRWFTAGPLAIQASRILLYLLYFFAGVGIGAAGFGEGVLAGDGGLARRWPLWLAATIATYGCIIGLIYIKHSVLPDVNHQPLWWETAYSLAFACYSAAQTLNVLALFLRFDNDGSSILDPLRDSAYGIYLIHYIPVLWLQYALHDFALAPVMQVSAILKAVVVFILTLALSWAATAALRKIPGATHVL